MPTEAAGTPARLLALAALLWAGMILGVSFLATPVKFAAPGLTLPVALEVGQVTFHLFSRVEWAFAAVVPLLAVLGRRRGWTVALALVAAAIVIAQSAWLLPVLDARIAAVVAGTPLPATSHHTVYTALEAVKLVAVLGLGGVLLFRR